MDSAASAGAEGRAEPGPVFDSLAGQPEVRAALARAAWVARSWMSGDGGQDSAAVRAHAEAAVGAMTHAWLFTGPPGSGRTVAARAFAAALQCSDPAIVGCGQCRGCVTVLAGTHPDVHVARTERLSLQLADVRSVIERGNSRPVSGNFSVVIVEDADRLTEQAGNALLKVIEEPSGRAIFMLCAPTDDPADVMVTLRSRSRHVYLRTPGAEAVEAVLRADPDV
ncbi:AAA family ATPase, partial [Dietzia sp.]|uniref:AAA family ATPase n=1 Tax=Dietzia sp. TaxID=1871616 RepID=UPI002FDAF534